jgi:glutamyl-tRNA reductase
MCGSAVDERMRGGKAHASIVPDIPPGDSIGPVVLLSLIASHHDLDLAVLERLSADTHAVGHEIVAGCAPVTGAVVLATCNRFELYLEVDDPEHVAAARAGAAAVVAARSGYSVDRIETELHLGTGVEVAEHLFAVASGLESMVVGEREISGQVRRSLSAARRDGTTTSDLEALFQAASRTSRVVGSSTGLGAAGRSVVSVALDLVEDDLPAWPDVRCVLIGTGSYAGASLAALKARGCADIRVFSASGRAHAFATARGVRAVTGADLHAELTDVDLVVACSGAPGAVLEVEALAAARIGVDRPLAVVDLALRHDVDPGVRELPGVRLVSLTTVSEHAPDEHSGPVAAAHEIVARTAADFQADRRMRLRNPGIIGERTRVLTGLETALEALGSTDERAVRALRRRTRMALHGPTVRARDAARADDEAEYAAALAELAAIPVPDVAGVADVATLSQPSPAPVMTR